MFCINVQIISLDCVLILKYAEFAFATFDINDALAII